MDIVMVAVKMFDGRVIDEKDMGKPVYRADRLTNRKWVSKFSSHPTNPIVGLEKLNALQVELSVR